MQQTQQVHLLHPQKSLCSFPRAHSKIRFPSKQILMCRFYCPELSMALTAQGLWLIHANIHLPLAHFGGSNPSIFSAKHQVFPWKGTGTPTVPNSALCSSPKLSTSCQSPPWTPHPECALEHSSLPSPKAGSSCQQRSQTQTFPKHPAPTPSPHLIEAFPEIFLSQLTEVSPRCNLLSSPTRHSHVLLINPRSCPQKRSQPLISDPVRPRPPKGCTNPQGKAPSRACRICLDSTAEPDSVSLMDPFQLRIIHNPMNSPCSLSVCTQP